MPEPQPDGHDIEDAREAGGRRVMVRADAAGILEAVDTSLDKGPERVGHAIGGDHVLPVPTHGSPTTTQNGRIAVTGTWAADRSKPSCLSSGKKVKNTVEAVVRFSRYLFLAIVLGFALSPQVYASENLNGDSAADSARIAESKCYTALDVLDLKKVDGRPCTPFALFALLRQSGRLKEMPKSDLDYVKAHSPRGFVDFQLFVKEPFFDIAMDDPGFFFGTYDYWVVRIARLKPEIWAGREVLYLYALNFQRNELLRLMLRKSLSVLSEGYEAGLGAVPQVKGLLSGRRVVHAYCFTIYDIPVLPVDRVLASRAVLECAREYGARVEN